MNGKGEKRIFCSSISVINTLSKNLRDRKALCQCPSVSLTDSLYPYLSQSFLQFLFLCMSLSFSVSISNPSLCSLSLFLVADTQLHKRLCPSVGRSVGQLVGRLVRRGDRVEKWENAHFRPCPPVRNWWPCLRPCFPFLSFSLH